MKFFQCAVLLIVIVMSTADATYIKFSQCTDTNFCSAETCQTGTLPAGSCTPFGNNSADTMEFLCDPTVRICGELFAYRDQFCTVLEETQAFSCGECNGGLKQVECLSENGNETLIVRSCQEANCRGTCTEDIRIPKDYCFPTRDRQGKIAGYAKYAGASVCTMAMQKAWRNRDCSGGPAIDQMVPTDRCINGNIVHCIYDGK